jgi:prepilin-type N-terminal cleavage/methylation domain-containing protein
VTPRRLARAFTLIEAMVVVAIVGCDHAIGVRCYGGRGRGSLIV